MSSAHPSNKHTANASEADALDNAIFNDSMYALAATAVGTAILSAAAQKFSPVYRGIPISAKTALILGPTIAAFYIRGEHVGTEFRRQKFIHQLEGLERKEAIEQEKRRIARSSVADRTVDFITSHRWSMLGYMWLAGISGSVYYLYRQKGMTWTQKVVQARMYAQAITLVGILSTAAVASLGSKANDTHVQHYSAALEAALTEDTKVSKQK